MKQYPFNGTPIITDKFRQGHPGVDYAMNHRTAIYAVASGKVILCNTTENRSWVANTSSDPFLTPIQKAKLGLGFKGRGLSTNDYGKFVKIDHGSDISTLSAHLDEVKVFEGQFVTEGELIGYSDSTGNSTGNHLHFELRIKDKCVDPIDFYNKNKDFEGSSNNNETNANFYPYETTVIVNKEVSTLFVRSGPATHFKLAGSQKLKGGDEVSVVGFVKGERIDYDNISTQFWWVSKKGNYFWSGGTSLIPSLDDFPNGMKQKDNTINLLGGEKDMTELEQKIKDLEAREAELAPTVEAKTKELNDVREELSKAREELSQPQPEPEKVDSVVEDVKVEEEVKPEAEPLTPAVDEATKEQVKTMFTMLNDLRVKLGMAK